MQYRGERLKQSLGNRSGDWKKNEVTIAVLLNCPPQAGRTRMSRNGK